MSVNEAYLAGKEAFKEGNDIMNIPSHYSTTERELFILGYEEAEADSTYDFENDVIDYYEDLDQSDDNELELDFD